MFVLKSILAFAWVLMAVVTSPVAASPRDEAEIQQWLTKHANQAQSTEVAAARSRVVGDLNGDGRSEVAVLYTLKPRAPRRGESRYLAVFKRVPDSSQPARPDGVPNARREWVLRYHAHVLVSGPGSGETNRVSIIDRTLVLEMLAFAPGDAACCPTRVTTRRYHMASRGLVLAPDVAKRAR